MDEQFGPVPDPCALVLTAAYLVALAAVAIGDALAVRPRR
jgi:hypothetical protein